MKFIDKNINLKYEAEFWKDEHRYKFNNKFLPSVTPIISNYFNTNYSDIKGSAYFNKAIIRGNIIHEFASRILYDCVKNENSRNNINQILELLNVEYNEIKELFPLIKKFNNFIKKIEKEFKKIIAIIEQPISDGLICGTPDLVYMENNNAIVVDFKTWKNVELKKIKMAQLQITGYAHLLKANDINVADKGEIWIINENGIERINFKITTKLNLEWQDAKSLFFKNSANFKEGI